MPAKNCDDDDDCDDSPLTLREKKRNIEGKKELPHNNIDQSSQLSPPSQKTRLVITRLRSRQFKEYLSLLMWKAEENAPGADSLKAAITTLSAKACAEGKQYTLYNRVAPAPDGVWIDMSDANRRAIKVTSEGWEIVDHPPILFRRYDHQKPLVEPTRISEEEQAAAASRLLDHTNIPKSDDATRLAVVCTYVSYLIPLIPHPLIDPYGPTGAAKSWLCKLIK